MNYPIRIEYVKDLEAFENLRADWERLLSRNPTQSIFLTWEWLFSWWMVNKKDNGLHLVTAWENNQLVGIAPLMQQTRKKWGVGIHMLTSLGVPQSDVGGFIYDPGCKEAVPALIHCLLEDNENWDILELNEFPESSSEVNVARDLFHEKGYKFVEEVNLHFHVPLEKDWEHYSQKLARKIRYNLRRAVRLAEEIGPLELKTFTGAKITPGILQMLAEINQHSNHPRLYYSKSEQALLTEISSRMKSGNWMSIFMLNLNNEPKAYEYGFTYNGCIEIWRAGFDTRLPNISIGKILSMRVIQEGFKNGIHDIDFLRGDEDYKQEWQPESRKFVKLRAFNNRILPLIAHQWLTTFKPLIKRLQKQD